MFEVWHGSAPWSALLLAPVELPRPQQARIASPVALCPGCGQPVKPTAKFCAACGIALPGLARSEPQAAPVVPPARPAGAQVFPSPAHQLSPPPTQHSVEPTPIPASPLPKDESRSAWGWVHFILVFSLAVCLFAWLGGAFALDLLGPEPTPIAAPQITPAPQVAGPAPTAAPDQRALKIGLTPDGRFGLIAQGSGLPASVQGKQLTFSPIGETSNTRLWLDGQTPLFGRDGRLSQFDFHPDRVLPGGLGIRRCACHTNR